MKEKKYLVRVESVAYVVVYADNEEEAIDNALSSDEALRGEWFGEVFGEA